MCPTCLATSAMAAGGTASAGGLVSVLAKHCIKRAAKEESQLAKASGLHAREESHEQGSGEEEDCR